MKHIASLMIMIAFACSCRSQQQNAGPQPTKDPVVYRGVTDTACAVEVAFGSYGSGIDGKALDKVMALIGEYEQPHTEKSIGREGETRLCLPLNDLKGSRRKAFISQLKKIAREAELVSVSIR